MVIAYRIYMIDTLCVKCRGHKGTDYKDYYKDISIETTLPTDFSNEEDAIEEIEGFNWKGNIKL